MKYKIASPHSESKYVESSLEEFIMRLPYVLGDPKVLPPIEVINNLFAEGTIGGGMSVGLTWEPFSITQSEYVGLASNLNRAHGIESKLSPVFVETVEDWITFRLFECDEKEASYMVALSQREKAYYTRYKMLLDGADENGALAAYQEYLDINTELNRKLKEKVG